LLVLPAIVLVAAACGVFRNHTKRYEPPGIQAIGTPVTGQEWYERSCAWCHGARGEGTRVAPPLVGDRNGAALTDFMLRTGRMPIQDVNEVVKRRPPALPPDVIEKIVRYVATLGGKGADIPAVDPAAGDLTQGAQLYQANCAACHSATGIGGTLAQGKEARF